MSDAAHLRGDVLAVKLGPPNQEDRMKRTTFYISILAVAIMAAASLTTMAQGTLRYQTRYSKSQVSSIISKLETSSDKFRRDFDKAMDNSRYNGTSAEDEYNDNVRDFEDSLDQLRREFNRTNSWWETRNQVSDVVNQGQNVNTMMNSISFRRTLERQWNNMRDDLNNLADTYDLPGLNGGGWNGGGWNGGNNGGGWNNGGQTSTPPSWAQGTFYGTAPNGSQIMLTIDASGRATANIGGSLTYGTYYRGIITFGGNQARVNKTNAGLETVSTMNGETIRYSRNGGGWDGGNNDGQMSNPPSWAQGTFYGTAPNGSQITLTIDNSGRATANVGGSITYGTYNRGIITFGGNQARVNKTNAGLETVSTLNRETIQYSRNSWGGGGGGNTGGRPPSWAIGTFRATNSPTGGSIIMTINRDGNVFVSMDGGAASSSGTLDGSLLTMGVNTARVYRQGNGFRTVSTTDGQTIYYVKN